jgi:hypothetical protein
MRISVLLGALLVVQVTTTAAAPPPAPAIAFAWAYRAGDYVRSQPVAGDQLVFVGGDDNALHAVKMASGE